MHGLEAFFQFDATRNRAFHENPDQALGPGAGDQAVRLGGLHAQKFRHFALRLAAGEVQPRGTGSQCGLLVHLHG
jgi:hypothetical protein